MEYSDQPLWVPYVLKKRFAYNDIYLICANIRHFSSYDSNPHLGFHCRQSSAAYDYRISWNKLLSRTLMFFIFKHLSTTKLIIITWQLELFGSRWGTIVIISPTKWCEWLAGKNTALFFKLTRNKILKFDEQKWTV